MRISLRRVWQKSRDLAPYGGAWTLLRGSLRRPLLRYLRRRFGFPPWHLWPVEWREYALEAAAYLQQRIDRRRLSSVVEVGCGLGEILGRLRCRRRVGYDTDPRVLAAARWLHSDVELRQGSFGDVREEDVGAAVALNFAHEIPPGELAADLAVLLDRCRPRYLLVDEVDYEYFHDYRTLLPDTYALAWSSREFPNRRRLRGFRRRGECNLG